MQGFFNEVALDLTTQQGKRLPVLVNATERRDADGRHLFTRVTIFNATDRRRYERELVEARATAEAAKKEVQKLHAAVQASLENPAQGLLLPFALLVRRQKLACRQGRCAGT